MGPLLWAFDLKPYQVFNMPPGDANTPLWDIDARAATPVTQPQCKLMVQHMLEDRFGLKYHYEDKQFQLIH